MIGWFGADVIDTVGEGVSDVGDLIMSVPGASALAEAMGDFAKTAVGQVVLRVISDSFFGSVAMVVGPQMASLTWAIPGLMRGDTFEKAWLDSFKLRVEETAEILGGPAAEFVAKQLPTALLTLAQSFGVDEFATWTEQQLAKAAGNIREDVSRMALDKWNSLSLFNPDDYDVATGRHLGLGASGSAVGAFGAKALTQAVVGRVATITNADRFNKRIVGSFSGDNDLPPSLGPPPSPPTRFAATAPPSPRNAMGANLALGATIVAALGALYWWSKS